MRKSNYDFELFVACVIVAIVLFMLQDIEYGGVCLFFSGCATMLALGFAMLMKGKK